MPHFFGDSISGARIGFHGVCQVCSQYGAVKEVIIMRNREDNSSKGAAFVKMEASPHACTRAYTLPGSNRRARLDRLSSHLSLWCTKSALSL